MGGGQTEWGFLEWSYFHTSKPITMTKINPYSTLSNLHSPPRLFPGKKRQPLLWLCISATAPGGGEAKSQPVVTLLPLQHDMKAHVSANHKNTELHFLKKKEKKIWHFPSSHFISIFPSVS